MTVTSTNSRHVSLYSAPAEYRREVLEGKCDAGRLAKALKTLLGYYFVASETPEERARQIAQMAMDLAEFSEDCVWWAMREWRQKHDRKPTPASLRQLCMMRRQEALKAATRPEVKPPATGDGGEVTPFMAPLSDAEKERRRAVIAKCAKAAGMNFDGRQVMPDIPTKPRTPHWSETALPDDPRWRALKEARERAGVVLPNA